MKRLRIFAVLALAAAVFSSCSRSSDEIRPTGNVILMIPDGTSTSVLACSRWYKQVLGEEPVLAVDENMCGLIRSFMSDAPISGSAGAMSAYMTGQLQQSANICIYPKAHPEDDFVEIDTTRFCHPLMTVMEAAKLQGKATGIVVTVEYPHATPAATSSHSYSRNDYPAIGAQMAAFGHDVLFGGGLNFASPTVRANLENNGTTLIESDVDAFNSFDGDGKVWALFAPVNMAYDLDRDPAKEPSLSEMTDKALKLLSRKKDGFFLMVEGSRVDYAAHANDPVGIMTEFIAFDDAVKVALDFAKKDGNTTVVVLPDHGNSGCSIGKPSYGGYSSRGVKDAYSGVVDFKCTAEGLCAKLRAADVDDIAEIFKEWTGIEITEEEEQDVRNHLMALVTDYMHVEGTLNNVVSRIMVSRTNFSFTSGSHTIEDVFLSVYNPDGKQLTGVHTNTELTDYLCAVAGIRKPLSELSDEYFAPAEEVFAGFEMTVDGPAEEPVLTVRNGDRTLVAEAYRAYVTVDGEKKDLQLPIVWMKKNKTFYLPQSLAEMLR